MGGREGERGTEEGKKRRKGKRIGCTYWSECELRDSIEEDAPVILP